MMNVNDVHLMGRVTRDPDLRRTQKGTAVLDFRMATNRKAAEGPGVTFVDVRAWKGLAEGCSTTLKRGYPVYVEGELRNEEFTDRTGRPRSRLYVLANAVQFLGGLYGGEKDVEKDESENE